LVEAENSVLLMDNTWLWLIVVCGIIVVSEQLGWQWAVSDE